MPQINIGSGNITTFGYSVTFDILNKLILFNLLPFTTGSGLANTKVAFSVIDSAGVTLASIDFTAPQIPNPAITPTWSLDLSGSPYAFLFSSFSIVGAIQDQGGQIYQIQPLVKTVCMPNDFQEDGSVPAIFQIISDCSVNNITVTELTVQIYNSLNPISVSKTGTLYYPTGTIASIPFSGTPFTNNQIYTGHYRIKCTTYATYDLGNDFYVVVGYVADQEFDINCTSKMADLLCCVREVQQTALRNCDNAKGERATQLLQEITIPFTAGILAEIRGMDASDEYILVKKTLNCNCGNSAIGQNEVSPINPAINTIVISGVGGTSVGAPVITGNTKTFTIQSNVYQITKGVPSDPAFTIGLDNSVPNLVKYPIKFNYLAMAQEIYTATGNDPTTLAQLNALVNSLGINLTGLDGSCIIDLTKVTYAISIVANGSTGVSNIVINGNTYIAPSGLLATDLSGFQTWLNSLSLGAWTVTNTSGTITILSIDNTNNVSTITFTGPNLTLQFGRTTKTLVQILQAIITYLCGITALQIAIGNSLSVCTFDYNGNIVTTPYGSNTRQSDFNQAVSNSLCNLAGRISSLTAITCSKIQSLFLDNPNASFNYATDRFLSIVNGACTSLNAKQAVFGILAAVNADPQTKAAWCAIDCSVPGSCPDISGINIGVVSGNIGFYGVSFNGTTTAAQTITLKYRVTGTTNWSVASNALLLYANGNVQGASPFLITGLTPGATYDVQAINNCGGAGFITTITVPVVSVFSTNVFLSNLSYLACAGTPTTVYSSSSFGVGVRLYTDVGLTIPVTGKLFAVLQTGGDIFNLNSTTGFIVSDTGLSCSSGTPGTYRVGGSSPAVCGNPNSTFYTNGAFALGKVLYLDSALTTPITGSNYVVQVSTNHIFNLNSSTGLVGSDTSSTCTGSATLTLSYINGGGYQKMVATLSQPIDAVVNINRQYADGFSDMCITNVSESRKTSTYSISIGAINALADPDFITGLWTSAIHYSVFFCLVNGISVVNGTVLTIGTYNVTIVIATCV